ncbi:hypothetical protein LRB11_15250, partial [Ectothiorhodospira haloalkaliphila]|nr:hypothetical protein [Ectothiorhodospira haloalkaliphila]
VQQAMNRLKELSADEEARRLAFVRERALRDEVSQLNEAKREGLEEGREEGLKEGREEGREEGRHAGLEGLLRTQLAFKFGELPTWVDERLSAASDEQLGVWGTRLLTANTLDELFKG